MNDIQTTGGLFTLEIRNEIVKNICQVFYCSEDDIKDLAPLQAGLTNIVLSFNYNGGRYIYRHPGLGSEELVSRSRETIMQSIVGDIGIDTTLVAMDADRGWKIARYVDHYHFNYHDLNDMVRGVMLLKKLHEAPCRVRCNFDVIPKSEEIARSIPKEKYGNFDDFWNIRDIVYKLNDLTKSDGIHKCNVHGDARDDNFLINKNEIYLTDWEYGGFGDPGFDIGSYICGGKHTPEDVDRILFTYFRRTPTAHQKRHFYAYIAITGYFYLHWVMLKESKGQKVGILKELWYYYAKEYSKIALEMYEEASE